MVNTGNRIRICLIVLLSISIIILFVDIINIFEQYTKYFKLAIFFNSMVFVIYFIFKSRFDQALTFAIVCILYNPEYPINLDNPIWRILEFPVICLFIHRMYFLVFENQLKQIERDADKLNQYLKELEHTIASLSYHQITLYLNKKHPQSIIIADEDITWKIDDLPNVEFSILSEFYTLVKNSKGGVNAKLINKYKNMEVHLNFNLTDDVKFTIIEGKAPHKPNRLARHIRNILVSKYHYLVL